MRLNPFKAKATASKRPPGSQPRPARAQSPGLFAVALFALFCSLVGGILLLAGLGNTRTRLATGARRVATSAQSTPAPVGFLGYKWGDPLRAVRTEAFIKIIGPNHEGLTSYSVKSTDSLFGLPVKEEGYWFSHGRFSEGVASVANNQSLNAARDALVKAFGPPSFASQQLWKWQWPRTGVSAQLNADTSIQIHIWNDAVHPVSFKTQNRNVQKLR